MDETLEKLVAQFGNPAELNIKVGREKVWPLREGKVVSPQWVDKLETALKDPEQLKGTVSVKRGDEKLYIVSNGTVELDEREALAELTQVESFAEQAEPTAQPAYLELLNSRLARVGEVNLTLDELRTDVDQSRAASGTSFVNPFDDIVIREGLERNLSREQTLDVLEQSPTLEGLSSGEVAQYRTQFENQYNSESARFLGIPLESEPVVNRDSASSAVALDDDVTGLPENLPEDESLRQDEGITEPEEFNVDEDVQIEDAAASESVIETAETVEAQRVYPGLDADYIPTTEPQIAQVAAPVRESEPFSGLTPALEVAQETIPEPLVAPRESITAAQMESLTTSFYGQTIDAYQEKFDRPLVSQMTMWPDQNHDALFTNAALDQSLSVEQYQTGLSQSPHILSQLESPTPEAVATHIAPLVASYESQLQAQQIYGESLQAYYEANPTQWQEKNQSLPALTDLAQYPQTAQEMDQKFTEGAKLLDLPKEQYDHALSNSPYVRMQLANQVSLDDITQDYIAPLTAAYEGQQSQQIGTSIENSLNESSVMESVSSTPVVEGIQSAEPEVMQSSTVIESPYLELLGRPNTSEEYDNLYQAFLHEPEIGVAADLAVQEAALSQGMAADEFLQTVTAGPYVQGRLDEGTPIADLNTVYLSQVMSSYIEEQQALAPTQTAVLEMGQPEEPIHSSHPELEDLDVESLNGSVPIASEVEVQPPEPEAMLDGALVNDVAVAEVTPAEAVESPVMEPVPDQQAVAQTVASELAESSPIAQFSETLNQPLSVPLNSESQQVALADHFNFPADALNRTDVVNGVLATAEPRLQTLQDGFATVGFELKNLAQHIGDGKFSDWANTQGKRVETAAVTMTESVRGRFSQWVDQAKTAAKSKVHEVGHTLKDKFDKAVSLVDSERLEKILPILPPQVDNYKFETDQGLRILRDGVSIYENGKTTPHINTSDSVFIHRLSERAEKHVSSMVDGLATLGGTPQPNGDRSFAVGPYTMSRAENGAVKLSEAFRGEILHAQNGKIRSSLTAEDYSRFQKFHQNTQVAVTTPVMAKAKGGIEVG